MTSTIEDRLTLFHKLMSEGMQRSRNHPSSTELFSCAALIATAPEIHPNHAAFATASAGYELRQQGLYDAAKLIVDSGLETFAERTDTGEEFLPTAGKGRLLEERGLIGYAQGTTADLAGALSTLNSAVEAYAIATDPALEAGYERQVEARRLRNLGLMSVTAGKLYDANSSLESYRERAILYAQQEVDGRLASSNAALATGHDMANAYHTLGNALTRLARDDDAYESAIQAFDNALQVQGINDRKKAGIAFGRVSLEYKREPDSTLIEPRLDEFLALSGALTVADLNAFRPKIDALKGHVSLDYVGKLEALYAPKE